MDRLLASVVLVVACLLLLGIAAVEHDPASVVSTHHRAASHRP